MIPRHLWIGVAVMLLAVITMLVYLRRMKRKVSKFEPTTSDLRPVANLRIRPQGTCNALCCIRRSRHDSRDRRTNPASLGSPAARRGIVAGLDEHLS